MDINDVNCFKVVAEEGSLNKACEKLYISRQGLAKIIRKLEDETGVKLFNISSTGVTLTEYGKKFYSYSLTYVRDHQIFLSNISNLRKEEISRLNIAVQQGFTECLGKNFMLNFILQNKDIDIQIHTYSIDYLKNNQDTIDEDILITTGQYDAEKFDELYVKTTKLFLLVSSDHPLTKLDKITMADLVPYKMIALSSDIGQAGKTNTLINQNKINAPSYYLNASDRNTIMGLIQNGLAISFNAAWNYREYSNITALQIEDMNVEVSVHILALKNSTNSLIKRFKKYISKNY